MFTKETHTMTADLGTLELWCNRCGSHVAHHLIVTTANEVTRTLAGTYRDENCVTAIEAACEAKGHKQTLR
ncbi:MAG: hypothetical protein ABI047_12700 [Jatrophihabitantaceae bacterium]